MRGEPLANLTRILSQSPIATIMQAIFDGPVVANQFEQAQGISVFGSQAGDPIDVFLCAFQRVFDASA